MPLVQPSIETLRGFGSFTRVITLGKKYESKPIKAFVFSSISKKAGLRVGFAVTRGMRKAVQRNLIKRLMREAFRTKREEFSARIDPGRLVEIVFLYNGDTKSPSTQGRFIPINQALAELSATMNVVRP